MKGLPEPAQYLLRIDDLCPTVHREGWTRIRGLLEQHRIRPILAVVPANQDAELNAGTHDPGFWQEMRDWQAAGAAIGLHGYSHVCSERGRGLVPLHEAGEFVGLPLDEQQKRIAAGCEILRGHGLQARLWVAPRHSFDWNTLRALRQEGIHYVSDGFARRAFVRGGMTWIPMQLWGPVAKRRGLWTICVHPNTLDAGAFERLRAFVGEFGTQFTSFDRVANDGVPARLGAADRSYQCAETLRLQLRRSLGRRRRG